MRLLLFANGGQCSCVASISGDVVVAKAVDGTTAMEKPAAFPVNVDWASQTVPRDPAVPMPTMLPSIKQCVSERLVKEPFVVPVTI